MSNRLTINLLAMAVIAAGASSLLSRPAQASTFGGCEDLASAKAEDSSWCASRGGSWSVVSSSCGSSGYTLSTNCAIQIQ